MRDEGKKYGNEKRKGTLSGFFYSWISYYFRKKNKFYFVKSVFNQG